MGNIVVSISVSLDGFFEGVRRDISWHQVDTELHDYSNRTLAPAAAFVEGRVTYELMEAYWPTAADDPDAPEPIREFARIWRAVPKIVCSTTLSEVGPNASLMRAVDADAMRRLKAESTGEVVVGGPNLMRTFRELDLVDEYRIYVHPVVLGDGVPLFPHADRLSMLRLIDTRQFGNGVVLLHYGRPE